MPTLFDRQPRLWSQIKTQTAVAMSAIVANDIGYLNLIYFHYERPYLIYRIYNA